MAEYASESGHWYERNGDPAYTLIGKNGKERNTTLRDARKLDLVPSVTTILSIFPKPALVNWLIEQAYLAMATLPNIKDETPDDFIKRAKRDAAEQALKARELGTEIHGDIERWFGGDKAVKHVDICVALDNALVKHFGKQNWSSEKSFSSELGFGGKVDLHSDEWVIDFKTKDFDSTMLDKTFIYVEHMLQLSAYRLGLKLPDAKLANVFISVKERGLIRVDIHKEDKTDLFIALLYFWKSYKKFDPSY